MTISLVRAAITAVPTIPMVSPIWVTVPVGAIIAISPVGAITISPVGVIAVEAVTVGLIIGVGTIIRTIIGVGRIIGVCSPIGGIAVAVVGDAEAKSDWTPGRRPARSGYGCGSDESEE